MATLVKTPSGTWKAVSRKVGFPIATKTFRTKRDAEDWSRRTENEMVRGVYIQRAPAERMTVADALKRYLAEVSPVSFPVSTKKRAAQRLWCGLELSQKILNCSVLQSHLRIHTFELVVLSL